MHVLRWTTHVFVRVCSEIPVESVNETFPGFNSSVEGYQASNSPVWLLKLLVCLASSCACCRYDSYISLRILSNIHLSIVSIANTFKKVTNGSGQLKYFKNNLGRHSQ